MSSKITNSSDLLISVIISNFNYGRYLDSAIQSVLEQTYKKIEIIVVDDGSSDESHSVINKFEGKILPIFQDHNGQCSALNAGFSSSHGDVIIFLDSDDSLYPNAIENLARPFIDNKNIIKSQAYMNAVDADGHSLGNRIPKYLSPSGNHKNEVLKHGPTAIQYAWTSGNAWARLFLKQVMPLPEDSDNRFFPDGILNPLAALYGPVVTLEKPVADYRIHGFNHGSIGKEFTVSSLRINLDRMRNNYEFIAKHVESLGFKPPLKDWFIGKSYWKDKLTVFAISLMDASQKKLRFREVVLAPFITRGLGKLKAIILALMLVVIWFSPRKQSLEMIRRLLRIPKSQKIHAKETHAR